jgi:hypothetical protein
MNFKNIFAEKISKNWRFWLKTKLNYEKMDQNIGFLNDLKFPVEKNQPKPLVWTKILLDQKVDSLIILYYVIVQASLHKSNSSLFCRSPTCRMSKCRSLNCQHQYIHRWFYMNTYNLDVSPIPLYIPYKCTLMYLTWTNLTYLTITCGANLTPSGAVRMG